MAFLTVEVNDSVAHKVPANESISFHDLEEIVYESETTPYVDFGDGVPAKDILAFIKKVKTESNG